jgi:histidine triad (HIT) family protein
MINNEISCAKVWEDEKFLVFLDIMPINPGHILLIPKNHNEDIFKLKDGLYNEIFKTAKKLSEPLKKVTNAKRVGMIIEGFGVDHSHIHLVPLYKERELIHERAKKASEDELKQMQLKLVEVFKII